MLTVDNGRFEALMFAIPGSILFAFLGAGKALSASLKTKQGHSDAVLSITGRQNSHFDGTGIHPGFAARKPGSFGAR